MRPTLVQKVLILVVVLFVMTCAVVGVVVARQIKGAYLTEQKRNVAEFVQKQAKQHLAKTDFQTTDAASLLPRFVDYQDEIITPEIVRIKIYNTKGVVLYSDQSALIGQDLFVDDPAELKEILAGNVVAAIAKPNKAENTYEKQYGQLLEFYTPISFDNSGVAGIVETYYRVDLLNSEILRSQKYLIASITFIFTILFALLSLIVRRASRTIIEQDKQLKIDIKKEQEYSSLKDEFIRLLSHQLRTPVSAIRWSLEVLTDKSLGKFSKEQREMLESINTNTESLIAIVDNSLIISDIRPDYFVFEKSGYSLLDLTNDILKSKAEKIKGKKVTIQLVPAQRLHKIRLKKDAMTKVVNKLLDNAIDYSPIGEKITITINQKGRSQHFEIQDRGIGIPKDEQAKVFDKFFRASNSIEQKNVGSGLSLYITKKIIEGYNGKIWFESGKRGSTCLFEIPTV